MNRHLIPSFAAGTLASMVLLVALDVSEFWWHAFAITMIVLVALLVLRFRQ